MAAGGAEASPSSIPAHWVSESKANGFEPKVGDFTFDDLWFTAPDDGWIVGSRFLLHVQGDRLRLTFSGKSGASFNSVHFPTREYGWAGGFISHRTSSDGVLWRYQHHRWRAADLSGVGLRNWTVTTVRFADPDDGRAAALVELGGNRVLSLMLHFDGSTWRLDPGTRLEGRRWTIGDMCVRPSGGMWAVGSARLSDAEGQHPLLVSLESSEWREVALPRGVGSFGGLSHVVCLGDEGAIAAGVTIDEAGGSTGRVQLLRYRNGWELVAASASLSGVQLSAVAATSTEDVWVAGVRARRPVFLHLSGGGWSEVPGPVLPQDRTAGYSVGAMQFPSPGEGWAVANDNEGPGLVRGLIFQYRDGVWRNRNWSWHFWDQRWFGLFGD
jgi:hypothetical protein